jgi:hypothetical protein
VDANDSIVVAGLVLPLSMVTLGAQLLIALFRGAHRLGVRRLGSHRWEREQLLQVVAFALWTRRELLPANESLELVATRPTLKIEQRHEAIKPGKTEPES